MTYVLAIVRHGVAAIIADSRVTSSTPALSHDDMAKVGILFPGCVFGVAGSMKALSSFVSDFQRGAAVDPHDIAGNWHYFQKYAASFQPSEHFQVVLAERSAMTPRLHVYDTKIGRVFESNGIVTLGSGRSCFDAPIKGWIEGRMEAIDLQLIGRYGNNRLFPSFICLQLIANVQGEHSEFFRRQDVGIGGVFHYVTQDGESEALQLPSIYLVASRDPPEGRRLTIKPFRLCGTSFGLTIQGPPPFDLLPSLHLNMAKKYRWPNWSNRSEVDNFNREFLAELNTLPFYNFLGVCFAEEKYSDTIIVDTTFTRDYVWTGGDTFRHEFRSQIENVFEQSNGQS